MTKRGQVYRCEVCGNLVEVLEEGQGELVCCNQKMKLLDEKTDDPEDALLEKHVPVIKGKKVMIGAKKHPMTEEHYIEWIEATGVEGEISKVFLEPWEKPEAKFCFEPITARCYCNLHGLWVE